MVKYLAIGPGAMGYFTFLGALTRLKQVGRLDELEEISGASAGALLAFVFALAKGDTTKVLDFTLTVPIKQMMKPNIKSLLKDWGLISNSKLHTVFSDMTEKFTGKRTVTFKELYDWWPVKIHMASYCVNTSKTVYFSVDSTPGMNVVDAVCATIAIPFIISSAKLNDGWHYIDGATAEAIPGGPFLARQREDVLVLAFEWGLVPDIKDIKSYALALITTQMRSRATYDFPILNLNSGDVDIFDFSAGQEQKLKLFMRGMAAQ
jgi:predicted acylesterase/phospholipase RssA